MLGIWRRGPENGHLHNWSERGCWEVISRIVSISCLERLTFSIMSFPSLVIRHIHSARISCMFGGKVTSFGSTGDWGSTDRVWIYLVCTTILLSPRRRVSCAHSVAPQNFEGNGSINVICANILLRVISVKALHESDSVWSSAIGSRFWITCLLILTGRARIGHTISALVLKTCCDMRLRAGCSGWRKEAPCRPLASLDHKEPLNTQESGERGLSRHSNLTFYLFIYFCNPILCAKN